MQSIIIDNITEIDVENHYLRVLKENKHLFPVSDGGYTVIPLKFQIMGKSYIIDYKIGDNDGKNRSGVLRLGAELFELLKIRLGSVVKVMKIGDKYTIV